jgi:hypothetical protein
VLQILVYPVPQKPWLYLSNTCCLRGSNTCSKFNRLRRKLSLPALSGIINSTNIMLELHSYFSMSQNKVKYWELWASGKRDYYLIHSYFNLTLTILCLNMPQFLKESKWPQFSESKYCQMRKEFLQGHWNTRWPGN